MSELERAKGKPLAETKVNLPAKGPEALSDRPSALIRQAMDDLEYVERTPGYKVHMGIWHGMRGGSCYVCMAGSVMAGTLQADMSRDYTTGSFQDRHNTSGKLNALDAFRQGLVTLGVLHTRFGIGREQGQKVQDIEINLRPHYTPYPDMPRDETPKEEVMERDRWISKRKRFGDYMNRLADELEKIGL